MTKTDDAKSGQDRVMIFDTTLRDGEQSPGATMTHAEKLEIASLLDEMGVDIIEAGFPIASDGDFNAVSEIAKAAQTSVVCGLARAQIGDIDRCWEAVKKTAYSHLHRHLAAAPRHSEPDKRRDGRPHPRDR
jgi:2-isopropylmalate synthase